MKVKVQLISTNGKHAVVIKVYSNRPNDLGQLCLQRTTDYSEMCMFKGGAEHAVHLVASYLADECSFRFGDDADADQVGKAAVAAFKEALVRGERNGFKNKAMEVGEDQYVRAEVSEGEHHT